MAFIRLDLKSFGDFKECVVNAKEIPLSANTFGLEGF